MSKSNLARNVTIVGATLLFLGIMAGIIVAALTGAFVPPEHKKFISDLHAEDPTLIDTCSKIFGMSANPVKSFL